jgi:TPR repeat protein
LGDFYRDGVYVKTGSHKEQIVDALESALRGQTQYTTVSVDDFDYNKVILPKDIEQAKYWWRLAAESGNETAKERLQRIYE